MKKQGLVLYHNKAREERIAYMVADCMRESGIVDEIIVDEVYKTIFHIYDFYPSIIVTMMPRDDYSSALFTMVKIVFQCVWISIPVEGFFRINEENVRTTIGNNNQPVRLIDYYWFWGNGLADFARKELLSNNKISSGDRVDVFGYLPYEIDMQNKYLEISNAYRELKKETLKYQKTILVVLAYMAIPDKIERWSATSSFNTHDKEEWLKTEKEVNNRNDYNDKYIDIIRKLSDIYPDYLFLLKVHPMETELVRKQTKGTRYDVLYKKNNIRFIALEESISMYFRIADILVHYGSTTCIEAYINHVTSVCISDERLGIPIYYGNKVIDIMDAQQIIEYIGQDHTFCKQADLSEAAYLFMNYEEDSEYLPSQKLVQLFRSVRSAQKINISQKFVKRKLLYKAVVKRIACFWKEMIKCYISGNEENGKRIKMWLGLYYRAALGISSRK